MPYLVVALQHAGRLTRQCSDESDAAVDRGRGECAMAINLAGARWDDKAGSGTLDESRPKELYALMPVIMIKAVMVDKADVKDGQLRIKYVYRPRARVIRACAVGIARGGALI